MSGIHTINTGSTNYLIEPTLYALVDNAGSTTLTNFELFHGVALNIIFTASIKNSLQINNGSAKKIYYNGSQISNNSNLLSTDRVYTIIYDSTLDNNNGGWRLIGNLHSDNEYKILIDYETYGV